jgi:hypothetical protein
VPTFVIEQDRDRQFRLYYPSIQSEESQRLSDRLLPNSWTLKRVQHSAGTSLRLARCKCRAEQSSHRTYCRQAVFGPYHGSRSIPQARLHATSRAARPHKGNFEAASARCKALLSDVTETNFLDGSAMPGRIVNAGANVRLAERRIEAFDVFDIYGTERRLRLFQS